MTLNPLSEFKEQQIRMAALVDSLPVGLVMTDSDDNPIMTNSALMKLLHYDSDKTLNQQLDESLDFQSLVKQCRNDRKACAPKEAAFGDSYLRVLMTPIMAEGEAIGAVALIEDITEAKLLERARDEFFSIASHELRTPLTAIRGNASLMLDYYSEDLKDKPELVSMINDIHESCIRLISIVNDFLDASRLEMERMEFAKEELNVIDLVQEVIRQLSVTAQEKKIDLAIEEPSQALPSVVADPNKAKQVLFNLIGNAVKFTKTGGVKINFDNNDKSIGIRIVDTGPGIKHENQKLLFRKFQQAGESIITRDMTQGTGLGLYISKLLAEGMGGSVELEWSEEGKGSVFSFRLPVIK